jgi:uncharacterized protein PFB0145c
MIIEKITLHNFRIHEYLEFKPVSEGINTINGTNGAGKSTIVDAFSWALFGTRLHGLKNANYIKEGINPKEEDVKVIANIKIDNRHLKIVRQILNDKGTTNCWVYSLVDGEYIQVAGPAVTHSESYIRREIGLDQDGFLTSVFIQQKQVDEIINATPTQRSKTIEKLIGIDSISNGIKEAKSDSRDLQKAASVIRRGDLDSIIETIDNQKEDIKKTERQLNLFLTDFRNIEKEYNKLNDYIVKEEDKKNKYEYNKNSYINKKELLKELKKSIDEDYTLYKSLKNSTTTINNINELISNKENLLSTQNKLNSDIANIKVLIKNNEDIIKTEINKALIDKEDELKISLDKFKEKLSNIEDNLSVNNAEIKRLENYLKLIEKGVSKCPTCGSEIDSNHLHKEEIDKELLENKENLNKNISNKEKIKNNINKANNLINDLNNQKEILNKQSKAKDELKKQRENLNTLNSKKIEIDTNLSVIQNKIDEYNDNKRNQELRKKLQEKINKQQDKYDKDLKSLKEEAEKLKKEQDNLDKEFNNKKKAFKNLDNKYRKVYADIEKYKERKTQEEQKLEILNKQYDDNKKAEKEYDNIINNLNIINQSIETLSNFKEDRLYKSIPKLTATASDILYKFTEGDFVELILDDKFNCSVKTKKGLIRAVEQLSGGELSSAAIALRLAISFFLSNSTDNLLILDEVLVSLTEQRAKLALEVISSIENTQIILIAHNGYANEMADKIINL